MVGRIGMRIMFFAIVKPIPNTFMYAMYTAFEASSFEDVTLDCFKNSNCLVGWRK